MSYLENIENGKIPKDKMYLINAGTNDLHDDLLMLVKKEQLIGVRCSIAYDAFCLWREDHGKSIPTRAAFGLAVGKCFQLYSKKIRIGNELFKVYAMKGDRKP